MGICTECIFIGEKKNSPGACRRFSENYICNSIDNAEIDFVTGAIIYASCRTKNQFGECEFFNDGKTDLTLYAWSNADKTFYTKSTSPNIEDTTYNDTAEPLSKIETLIKYYAWIKNDDPEGLIYTQTDDPESVAPIKVYNKDFEEVGEADSISVDNIIYNSLTYTRSSDADIIIADDCLRNPDLDYTIRVPVDEESPSDRDPADTPDDSQP